MKIDHLDGEVFIDKVYEYVGMNSKEKVLVLFGDSLTDYFPMELFKDVEAQVYNRGEAGNTVPEMAARAEMDVVSLRPDLF